MALSLPGSTYDGFHRSQSPVSTKSALATSAAPRLLKAGAQRVRRSSNPSEVADPAQLGAVGPWLASRTTTGQDRHRDAEPKTLAALS